MYKKTFSLLVTTIAAGLVLSACSGPNPPQEEIKLNLNGDSTTTAASPTSATSPAKTNPVTTKGNGMKTLSDFKKIEAKEVTLTTTKGDITFEIYTDKVPLTAQNFLNLAESGYYDGIVFHRVIPDFMAQVGDPLTKDESQKAMWGTGGPGYTIADEFDPTLRHNSAGVVSMANTGRPGTGGSQFFITYGPTPHLDDVHAIFGKVTTGMDVLEKITVGDKINKVSFK